MFDVLDMAPIPFDGPNASSNDEHESHPFDVELNDEYIFLLTYYLLLLFYFIKKQYNILVTN
jgi:hypothetical protein